MNIRAAADATRVFVRDVKKFFPLVKGGHRDEVRCLFLASALEGLAKRYHDEWTLAQEDGYTSDGLLAALLARFAPQIQPRDQEARHKLSTGRYRMRTAETVPAYQARYDALVTAIPDLTESERKFWFHTGLSDALYESVAKKSFLFYSDMVEYVLRKERQFDAAKLARSPAARFNFLSVQELEDEDSAAKRRRVDDQAAAAGRSTAPPVAAAVARPSSPPYEEVRRRRKQPAVAVAAASAPATDSSLRKPTKFGYDVEELLRRQSDGLCLGCGSAAHTVSSCTDQAWLRRKAVLDAKQQQQQQPGAGQGKGKGKRWFKGKGKGKHTN
jgi:hypothetical protein